jgi:hypothetical protein
VELAGIEREMAALDAVYRPVARRPVDLSKPGALADLGTRVGNELARLSVNERAEAVLYAVIERYAAGDEALRAAIRRLFDRYPSFRWAAHLPRECSSATQFRAHLIHLSARDQDADARDEILTLQALVEQARRAGVDTDPIVDEVAEMSSTANRYGMGSMRAIILRYSGRSE